MHGSVIDVRGDGFDHRAVGEHRASPLSLLLIANKVLGARLSTSLLDSAYGSIYGYSAQIWIR